jgi:WD40 repeat protein
MSCTHFSCRPVVALLGVLCLAPPGSSQPPRSVVSADLRTGGKAVCVGMKFLPDGGRVAVRWEWIEKPGAACESRIGIVGGADGVVDTIGSPSGNAITPLHGNQLVVTGSGEILTPGERKDLLRYYPKGTLGSPPPSVLELSAANPKSAGAPVQVWLAGKDDALFVTQRGESAYRLSSVERLEGAGNKGVTKVLVNGGGTWEDLLLGTDLHPSGKWFAACYSGPVVKNPQLEFWELSEPPRKKSLRLQRTAMSLCVGPDGKWVAAGLDDGRVAFIQTADMTVRDEPVQIGRFTVSALAHHPRGPYLACATFDSKGADNLAVIRTDTGEVVTRFSADPNSVLAICFNSTGSRMATFGGSGRVTIWDTSNLVGPQN